jgi:hypothetical protein
VLDWVCTLGDPLAAVVTPARRRVLHHGQSTTTSAPWSIQAASMALDDWLHLYNHHRAHTALGGLPPISRVNNAAS